MIPERLSAYRPFIPLLHEATQWTILRQWSLSEVYRVTLASGETRIVKWGAADMAGEAAIYAQLLQPLAVTAPRIDGLYQQHNSAVIIMEDCGTHDLEQQPRPELFLEAARALAAIRNTAARHLPTQLSYEAIRAHSVTSADFCDLLDDLLRFGPFSDNHVLAGLRTALPRELHALEGLLPLTLIHHDFHAKNIVVQANRVMPVDWSLAYLNRHLGDLYCLAEEAAAYSNMPKVDVLAAFHTEFHAGCHAESSCTLTMEQLEHQVRIGGICWLIKSLRWLVYGGTAKIAGSEAWVPNLLGDLQGLARQIG